MQLYAGLPIITNKVSVEEQQGIPHHLLGCIGLHEQPWVVGTFVKKALATIEEIRSRGKLPILVGGTHYYTQSLLFNDRLADEDGQGEKVQFVTDTKERWPILQQPTEVLLQELKKVDPTMADRWHPNDRRKIQRSLEVYLQTGKKASEIYAEQRERNNGGLHTDGEDAPVIDGPTMRFPNLLFWVHADNDRLRERLDNRVDKMLEQGLLKEAQALNAFANGETANGRPVDETRGIWVSIGYKEFKAYTQALEMNNTNHEQLEKLKSEALERTRIATRQYAKRQLRWIRIKLVNGLSQANASQNLYLLDGSEISSFDQDVVAPAFELTQNFLSAAPMPDPTSVSDTAAEMLVPKRDYDLSATPEKWTRQHCERCGVTCVTEEQWALHVRSKAHRKLLSRSKRDQELNGANGTSDPDREGQDMAKR